MEPEFAVMLGLAAVVVLVFVLIVGLPYLAEWGKWVFSSTIGTMRRLWRNWKEVEHVLLYAVESDTVHVLVKNFRDDLREVSLASITIFVAIVLAIWVPEFVFTIAALAIIILGLFAVYLGWKLRKIMSSQKDGRD